MSSSETTTVSTPKKTSLELADVQALGFEFDTDRLANVNTRVSQNYFFIKPERDGIPAMRLNISRYLRTKDLLWYITVYGGIAATIDLGTLISSRSSSSFILASANAKPDEVISTMTRLIAEAEEKVRNSSEIGSIHTSVSQQIGDLMGEDQTIPRPSKQ